MRLFLAEKPSVGREISKYLPGRPIRKDGYIDHGDDIVTWAFGHMLEQAEPADYDARFKRWNANDLPIVPETWKLLVTKSSEKQFHQITQLLAQADSVVHAGDPDREGQLLIDEILVYLNYTKPVQRILVNALDEKSIQDALHDLRDNATFYNLRQSALARARADWLIGMNLSRAYTLSARRSGHSVTFPIGRVKTPTLALVVRREEELQNFKAVQYYTLHVTYDHANGNFTTTWQPTDTQRGLDSEGRLLDATVADEVIERLKAQPIGSIADREKKKKKENQRLPLSLSALQVVAGKMYGYSPQEVLEAAQTLYERKYTSYPRSDCDYLPQSQLKDAPAILNHLQKSGQLDIQRWCQGANLKIRSKAWNDKKITAHHAIIPTTVACPLQSLPMREQRIYRIIAQAYIAQFYPIHEYEQTKITVLHEGETFVAHGRVVTVNGWKDVYTKVKSDEGAEDARSNSAEEEGDSSADSEAGDEADSGVLPLVKKGDSVTAIDFEKKEKTTKPPSRFTSSTLLQAMKEIHKYVKNEDVKKQLKDVSGIGTEATRATIINDLIERKFMEETGKKKVLKPTEIGFLLIHAIPDEMSYPDETAFWEERLARMSRGEDSLESFLQDQQSFLTSLVQKAGLQSGTNRSTGGQGANGEAANRRTNGSTGILTDIDCPSCKKGKLVQRTGKFGAFYGCSNYPQCKYTRNIATESTAMPTTGEVSEYKCPRCMNGYFIKTSVQNRIAWRCSNSPQCKTTCADVDGKPSIFLGK